MFRRQRCRLAVLFETCRTSESCVCDLQWTKAARKFRSDLCTAHKGPILDHLGRPDVKDDPLDERGVPKAAVVERLLQRAHPCQGCPFHATEGD